MRYIVKYDLFSPQRHREHRVISFFIQSGDDD